MVLIVSVMEGMTPVCVCVCVCILPGFIDHVPGAWVNAQGFLSAAGQTAAKVTP